MTVVNFLHVSDIHWSPKNETDIKIVISALIRDLNKLLEEGLRPDFVIFSGDLVWSGSDPKHFERAYTDCILPILKTCGLTKERMFFCAGNHDIDRNLIDEYMESGLKSSLKSSDAANKFVDGINSAKSSNKIAFERLKAYNNFLRTKTSKPPNVHYDNMLQAYKFEVKGEQVGIAVLNTAWRCTGAANDADRNALIISERSVDEGIRAIEGCDLKIAVFHHPTDWLTDFDQAVVLSRLYSGFDLLVHGHIHRPTPEQKITTSGTAIVSQAGCLYNSRNYHNSYQIVSIDAATERANIHIRTFYDSPRREFDAALNVNATGILSCDFFARKKTPQNDDVRRILKEVGLFIREKEANHLDMGGLFSNLGTDVRTMFVCPPLSARKHTLETEHDDEEDRPDEKKDEEVSLDSLMRLDRNLLFISQKEGGKTSLANHIAVLTSEGLCDKDRVPVIVGYKYLLKGKRGVVEEFQTYYKGLQRRIDHELLLKNGDILIIVDDLKLGDLQAEKDLRTICNSFKGVRFIFLADRSGILGNPSRENLDPFFHIVHIKPLPRRAIRELSKKWCQITGNDDVEANQYIIRQVKENNLPRTGYIVSLLIWAYQKQLKMERINEAFLLNAMIDSLLEKADFTKALRREFDPVSAEITLQEIAFYMRGLGGVITIHDLMKFVVGYFEGRALDFNALDVINQLIRCGLLVESGNQISFKYKCFQDYFVAGYLKENDVVRTAVVTEDAISYSRELYLLSGLRRKNFDILDKLRNRLERSMPPKLGMIDLADFVAIAEQSIFDPSSHKKLTAIKTKKMTANQVDDLLDAAEKELEIERPADTSSNTRSEKPSNNSTDLDAGSNSGDIKSISDYMLEVSLFGSIIKNSEFDEKHVKETTLDFYIGLMIKFQVYITQVMDDLVTKFFNETFAKSGVAKAKEITGDEAAAIKAKLLLLMQRVMITILTLKITDDIASDKLKVTYREYVDNISKQKETRLFMSLVMYDINQNHWDLKLKEMIDLNGSPFILDVVTERLWHDLYNRYENDNRRSQIAQVVDHIMGKVSNEGERRRTSRQAIDKASNIAQVRGRV